jgi:hypothetical protein
MSKQEILDELPKLKPEEVHEIFEKLYELKERSVLTGGGPAENEKRLLDAELEDYNSNPDAGSPWAEVEKRIVTQG